MLKPCQMHWCMFALSLCVCHDLCDKNGQEPRDKGPMDTPTLVPLVTKLYVDSCDSQWGNQDPIINNKDTMSLG